MADRRRWTLAEIHAVLDGLTERYDWASIVAGLSKVQPPGCQIPEYEANVTTKLLRENGTLRKRLRQVLLAALAEDE